MKNVIGDENFQKYMNEIPLEGMSITRGELLGDKAVKSHWNTWQAAINSIVITTTEDYHFENISFESFEERLKRLGIKFE